MKSPLNTAYSTWPEREQLRYCLAREIWPIRDQLTPNPVKVGETSKRVSWAKFFEIAHGVSLEDYARSIQADGHGKQVTA